MRLKWSSEPSEGLKELESVSERICEQVVAALELWFGSDCFFSSVEMATLCMLSQPVGS